VRILTSFFFAVFCSRNDSKAKSQILPDLLRRLGAPRHARGSKRLEAGAGTKCMRMRSGQAGYERHGVTRS